MSEAVLDQARQGGKKNVVGPPKFEHPEKTFKVLLLGAGETGKSTITKQLKLLYNQREDFAPKLIQQWLCNGAVESSHSLASLFEEDPAGIDADVLTQINDLDCTGCLTQKQVDLIDMFWKIPAVKSAYMNNKIVDPKIWIMDQAPFYLDHVRRYTAPTYKPDDNDIVNTRVRTVGTMKAVDFSDRVDGPYLAQFLPIAAQMMDDDEIPHDLELKWQVIDVGGQRNERRKWLHVLDDVMCLVWTCGLTEYCNLLFEDLTMMRVFESLELFAGWANNKQFAHLPIVIVFTKLDTFNESFDLDRFVKTFKNPPEGMTIPPFEPPASGDVKKAAMDYLLQLFKSRLEPRNGSVTTLRINTTDPDAVEDLVTNLKSIVASRNGGLILDYLQTLKAEKKPEGGKTRGSIFGGMKKMSLSPGFRRSSAKDK